MVVNSEMDVVNFTSPVARSPFPNGSASGKAMELNMLCMSTRRIVNRFVCGSNA